MRSTGAPLILSFDTSAAHVAAAVLSGDRIIAEICEDMAKGQAERLMPLLAEVLIRGGAEWPDLSRIGVGIGPGNFTGIRISVAAARGLALSLRIPAVGVNSFEATALGQSGPVTIEVPALRGQTYRQSFGGGSPQASLGVPEIVAEGTPCALRCVARLAPGPLVAAIARIAALRGAPGPRPAPMYLRAADAAPPRDPAPILLP